METSEMLDVVHALFEDDILPRWEQDAEVKEQLRDFMYRSMYKREYKYGRQSGARTSEWAAEAPELYDSPDEKAVKPYIPPSTEEELAQIVGPALGE